MASPIVRDRCIQPGNSKWIEGDSVVRSAHKHPCRIASSTVDDNDIYASCRQMYTAFGFTQQTMHCVQLLIQSTFRQATGEENSPFRLRMRRWRPSERKKDPTRLGQAVGHVLVLADRSRRFFLHVFATTYHHTQRNELAVGYGYSGQAVSSRHGNRSW